MDFQSDTASLSNEPFIRNQFGDRYLYSINRHAFEKIGSDGVYRSRWGETLFTENTLYIIAGCDSGVLLRYLQKRGLPDGSRYIIVELPELLPLFKTFINPDLLDNKIKLCTLGNWLDTAKKSGLANYTFLDSVEVLRSLAVDDAFYPAYRELWRQLEQETNHVSWNYRIELGSVSFTVRHIENVCENRHSAYYLKNLFRGKTAVLLAGGPSLDKILPWVIDHRHQLLVVAVSRISRRLQQIGFSPDIIVTVDPHPVSFDVSKQMLRFYKDSLLVNAFHATPLILGQWCGMNLYMDKRFPWNTDGDKNFIKGKGPTVSNSAINLMIEMGCRQIILAGLDLCFSKEGYSHAQGSDERKAGAFLAYGAQTVKTNSGHIAETDNSFFNAVSSIETQAKYALEHDCQLINPSPAAAAMENVAFTPLENITIYPLQNPAKQTIKAALPEDTPENRLASYQYALKEFEKAIYKLEKIKKLAQKALEHNDGLFGRGGKTADFKHKLHMDKLEKQLNKEFPDFGLLCKLFGMAEFIKVFSPYDAEDWTDDDIEQKGRIYYTAYLRGADNLMELIDTGKKRILCRIEEEQSTPDFDLLINQWESDQQPGRQKVWRLNHPDTAKSLTASVQQRFSALNELFEAELAKTEHGYQKQINRFSSLAGVAGKAYELFQNEDRSGLQRLILGLNTRPEPLATILHSLVSGYYAELEQNTNEAIEHYQSVVITEPDRNNPALENALIRLVYLALEHNHLLEAEAFLEALSGLSPAYLPQYAEILRINGKMQQSIDIYTHYLTLAPEDLATMLKLALLYKKLGVNEGAKWLFTHILEKDPHNDAARELLNQLQASA